MDREEQFRRNLKHAIELVAGLIEHPESLERMPSSAFVVSMPSDDPELCTANEEMMRTMRAHSASPHDAEPTRDVLSDSTLLVNV